MQTVQRASEEAGVTSEEYTSVASSMPKNVTSQQQSYIYDGGNGKQYDTGKVA